MCHKVNLDLLEACKLAHKQLEDIAFELNRIPRRYAAAIHRRMPNGYDFLSEAIQKAETEIKKEQVK